MEVFLLIILFIFGIPFVLFWTREWIIGSNLNINNIWIKGLTYIHFITLTLFIISLIINSYYLSFRGKNSTSIIFNLAIFSAIFLYLIDELRPRIKKFYFSLIVYSLGAFSIFYFFTFTLSDNNDTYYNDNNYRLERTFNGIMGRAKAPDLFVKKGIFEKQYKLDEEYISKDLVDSIIINDLSSSYEVAFYHRDTSFKQIRESFLKWNNPLKVIVNKQNNPKTRKLIPNL